jgi:penicillin amidase
VTQTGPEPRRVGLRRLGRLGLLIGLGVLVLAGVGVWVASRQIADERAARDAFPMVSGQLRVEGLVERVGIDRDVRGIPHVLASNEADAWFGLGFAHAQDRLAQMLWLRRIALGRTAERLGEEGLDTDRLIRTLGIPQIAEAEAARLSPEASAALTAYAAGVDARMARIRAGRVAAPLPLQMRPGLVRIPWAPEPTPVRFDEPWRPADSLAIGKLVSWGAGASHERPVVLWDLIERLGGMGSRPFFPGGERELGLAVPLDDPGDAPSGETRHRSRSLHERASWRASAWAVPGRLTSSGSPILVAELSVAPMAPSLLYEAHVRGGGLDVAGVTVPGLPVFWAGRNPDLAWAASPLPVATVDLFKESLRRGEPPPGYDPPVAPVSAGPADSPRPTVLYQNGSRWVPVAERFEEITVGEPGSSDARVEQLRVRETRHGPLINTLLASRRLPLSLAWTGARKGDPITGLLRLARARSAQEVKEALALHRDPPVEVVYAAQDGSVGLQVAGWLPQRTLPSGLSPVPGRLRAFDWRSGIDLEALPHLELGDDSGDWLVTTGTELEEELSGVHFEWLWRSQARASRLRARLEQVVEGGKLELRAAAEVQDDVAANADPQLVAAMLRLAGSPPELSPEAEEVVNLLRTWDGIAGTDSRGAVAFQLLIGHLLEELLAPTIGPELMERYLSLPGVEATALAQSIVIGAARSGREGGWTDPRVVSEAVREALRRTWMSLSYRLGHNRERWTWGRLHSITFRPFEMLDPEAEAHDGSLGPFPMAGQAASVARAVPDRETFSTRRASTYRMAVDLASPDRMLTTLAPGQSEHSQHPHFDDGVAPWREGRTSLVVTSPFLLEQAAVERLVLEPSK